MTLDQQPSRHQADHNKQVEDAAVQSGPERILGRPARTSAEWVADHAAALQTPAPD